MDLAKKGDFSIDVTVVVVDPNNNNDLTHLLRFSSWSYAGSNCFHPVLKNGAYIYLALARNILLNMDVVIGPKGTFKWFNEEVIYKGDRATRALFLNCF